MACRECAKVLWIIVPVLSLVSTRLSYLSRLLAQAAAFFVLASSLCGQEALAIPGVRAGRGIVRPVGEVDGHGRLDRWYSDYSAGRARKKVSKVIRS